mmetsp:Transcript_94909/g.131898  ORF Transcript_94909/g.131898 Transcript_94909/m.131898 type:complete len:143 (+) Transcript_94909:639-1067(+)
MIKDPSKPSGGTGKAGDRYEQKDSLYLDLGKPEMQGKVDTLTSGSHNNSLLLNHGLKGSNQGGEQPKEGSLSGFASNKKNLLMESKKKGQSSSFKNPSGSSSLHKHAIFKKMQEGGEEVKDDDYSPDKKSGFGRMMRGQSTE